MCPCLLHRRRCCTATTTTCTTTTTTTTTAAAGIKQQSPSRLVKDRQKPKLEHGTDYNVGGQDKNRLQRRHFTTILFDSSLSLLDAQWRNQDGEREKKKNNPVCKYAPLSRTILEIGDMCLELISFALINIYLHS